MKSPVTATGAAAALSAALCVTVVWLLKTYAGVEVPDLVVNADQAAITLLLGYFIHNEGS